MNDKKIVLISVLLFIVLSILGCSAKSQTLKIEVFGWEQTPVTTAVHNTAESIKYFCTKTLNPFYKKSCLEELFVYYNGDKIATIYAGDPERPFYVEGITEFEYFEMDSCIIQIFKDINK